jgi:hypothetical protein
MWQFFIIKNLGFNKLDSIKPFVQPMKKSTCKSQNKFYFYFLFLFLAVQKPMLIGVKVPMAPWSPWLKDNFLSKGLGSNTFKNYHKLGKSRENTSIMAYVSNLVPRLVRH